MPIRPVFLALGALLLAAPAPAAEFNEKQRSEIETVIRDYLLNNPEIIQEVVRKLEEKQAKAQSEARQEALKTHAETLFRSPRQVVLGNPQGRITLVEFFDYNCGYCRRALSDMQDLLKSDGDLRIVLKEFPILSAGSLEAARVSIAAMRQDRDKYLVFHTRLLSEKGQVDKAKALEVAKAAGFDVAAIERSLDDPEVMATIEESHQLANALGITGTPSYVIENEVISGAVGVDALKDKIEEVRDAAE